MTHPTKLTLRLDSGLIESAKAFAHENDRSLSQLVADYFVRLAAQPIPNRSIKDKAKDMAIDRAKGKELTQAGSNKPLSPITASLRGSWAAAASRKKGQTKPISIDDYHVYLEKKHQ